MSNKEAFPIHNETCQKIGFQLRRYRLSVSMMPIIGCEYDLMVNGHIRIEVKVADLITEPNGLRSWQFNIHRHGKMPKVKPDFYIFTLRPIPDFGFKKNSYLIVPGHLIKKPILRISIKTLFRDWWTPYYNKWEFIRNKC